jgi:hypothetical protein
MAICSDPLDTQSLGLYLGGHDMPYADTRLFIVSPRLQRVDIAAAPQDSHMETRNVVEVLSSYDVMAPRAHDARTLGLQRTLRSCRRPCVGAPRLVDSPSRAPPARGGTDWYRSNEPRPETCDSKP